MNNLSAKIKRQIASIIDDMLKHYDLETCGVEVAEDASGDEAIFVDLCYKLSPREFDPVIISDVRSAVREMLLANNEIRFPYIRHHLQSGQKVKAA
jgi:hypothetical protein